jgi:hypothetical protein
MVRQKAIKRFFSTARLGDIGRRLEAISVYHNVIPIPPVNKRFVR